MFKSVGGVPISITIDGRDFTPAGDNFPEIIFGGFDTEVAQNGNGTARQKKSRNSAQINSIEIASIADDDLHYLTEITRRQDFVPVSITLINGDIYAGEMMITDAPTGSTENATISISLAGPSLTRQ